MAEDVENYIKEQEKAFHEEKNRTKKHFSQVFGNPLQGYPHNEEFEVKKSKKIKKYLRTKQVSKRKQKSREYHGIPKQVYNRGLGYKTGHRPGAHPTMGNGRTNSLLPRVKVLGVKQTQI